VAATKERGFVDVTKHLAAALAKETGVIEVELGGALVRVRGEVDGEMLETFGALTAFAAAKALA